MSRTVFVTLLLVTTGATLPAACGETAAPPSRRGTAPRRAGPPPGSATAAGALPRDLVAPLRSIRRRMHSADPSVRQDGLTALTRMIKGHPRLAALAARLVRWRSIPAVRQGLRIWARIPSHPAFVPTLKRLAEHPADAVRRATFRTASQASGAALKRLVPILIKATRDPSCNVRFAALQTLRQHASEVDVDLRPDVDRALKDSCPLLQAWGAHQATGLVDESNPGPLLLATFRRLLRSPYAQVRCATFLALGRLRVQGALRPLAERAMAHALLQETSTALVVYDRHPRASVTHDHPYYATLPACAARALTLLHRKPRASLATQGPTARTEVRAWRRRLRRRYHLARPPATLCLAARHCNASEVCSRFTCHRLDQRVDAYWAYVHRRHCAERKPDPDRPWHDFTDPVYRASGFGLDEDGPGRIADALRKADRAAYDEHRKEVIAKPCP